MMDEIQKACGESKISGKMPASKLNMYSKFVEKQKGIIKKPNQRE